MTELSAQTIAICNANYTEHGKRNGCGKCPLMTPCFSPMRGWGWEALAEHNRKINEAAREI